MTSFVYKPQSGDRVFAHKVNGIVSVKWRNGCRHLIGGVHLTYPAAIQGQHWRVHARAMATNLINLFNGAAWDEQGLIHLYVRAEDAPTVDLMMKATRSSCGCDNDHVQDRVNLASTILAGWSLSMDNQNNLRPGYLPPDKHFTYNGPAIVKLEETSSYDVNTNDMISSGKWSISLDIGEDSQGGRVLQEFIRAPKEWGHPTEVSCGYKDIEPVPTYNSVFGGNPCVVE